WFETHAPRVAFAAAALVAAVSLYQTYDIRWKRERAAAWDLAFRQVLTTMPFKSAVIFVHYAPRLGPHSSIVANSPSLPSDSIWIVNDLGKKNSELMKHAGGRVPLAFYEDSQRIEVDSVLSAARVGAGWRARNDTSGPARPALSAGTHAASAATMPSAPTAPPSTNGSVALV